jgi:predicted secreted hydrolase
MIKKLSLTILVTVVGLAVYLFIFGGGERSDGDGANISPITSMQNNSEGFKKADQPIEFEFPKDFGPHSEYKIEWWYITGNLVGDDQRRFGYQMTFFRTGLVPYKHNRKSEWASGDIYMAHLALTDIQADKFYYFERFSRGANELAGAEPDPFRVWLEDWEIKGINTNPENFAFDLSASHENIKLKFNLKTLKPPVFHGDEGLSQKSSEPGNASYYFSYTRLETKGTIKIGEDRFDIKGFSWKDREWSTSALSREQSGWDWFSIQLENNTEIMYFQLRGVDNKVVDFSKGTIIDPNGEKENLTGDMVELNVSDYWVSNQKIRYPSAWHISIPSKEIYLEIEPLINDQELNLSVRYWEGAVKVKGSVNQSEQEGFGYVEMTGYTE